tara:strand:+ start:105 stop:614 length:510 start_codon:yes stop_codon:yes gene_type:complete
MGFDQYMKNQTEIAGNPSGEKNKLLNPRKASRSMTYNLLMQPKGLSAVEKRQYTDASSMQQNAAIQAAAQNVSQNAMAAGPQYAGQYAKAQKDVTDAARSGQAQASAEAEQVSQAKAVNQRAQLMSELGSERDRATQQSQFYVDQLFGTASTIVTGLLGGGVPGKTTTG